MPYRERPGLRDTAYDNESKTQISYECSDAGDLSGDGWSRARQSTGDGFAAQRSENRGWLQRICRSRASVREPAPVDRIFSACAKANGPAREDCRSPASTGAQSLRSETTRQARRYFFRRSEKSVSTYSLRGIRKPAWPRRSHHDPAGRAAQNTSFARKSTVPRWCAVHDGSSHSAA